MVKRYIQIQAKYFTTFLEQLFDVTFQETERVGAVHAREDSRETN